MCQTVQPRICRCSRQQILKMQFSCGEEYLQPTKKELKLSSTEASLLPAASHKLIMQTPTHQDMGHGEDLDFGIAL